MEEIPQEEVLREDVQTEESFAPANPYLSVTYKQLSRKEQRKLWKEFRQGHTGFKIWTVIVCVFAAVILAAFIVSIVGRVLEIGLMEMLGFLTAFLLLPIPFVNAVIIIKDSKRFFRWIKETKNIDKK